MRSNPNRRGKRCASALLTWMRPLPRLNTRCVITWEVSCLLWLIKTPLKSSQLAVAESDFATVRDGMQQVVAQLRWGEASDGYGTMAPWTDETMGLAPWTRATAARDMDGRRAEPRLRRDPQPRSTFWRCMPLREVSAPAGSSCVKPRWCADGHAVRGQCGGAAQRLAGPG